MYPGSLAIWLCLSTPVLAVAADVPQLLVPRSQTVPVVDGKLDDACWERAALIDGLGPARGGVNGIGMQPTEVRLVWSPEALHIAFNCRDDDIFADPAMADDDNLYKADVCELFIDGKGDQRQWIEIQVSPLNRVLDLVSTMTVEPMYTEELRLTQDLVDREFWSDRSWKAQAISTSSGRLVVDGQTVGWTVEMSVPASAFVRRLGVVALSPMSIRANILRYDHPLDGGSRRLVQSNWAPVAHGCPHISPAAMGVLRLVEPADTTTQLSNGGTYAPTP
jgi:hypothetical protein